MSGKQPPKRRSIFQSFGVGERRLRALSREEEPSLDPAVVGTARWETVRVHKLWSEFEKERNEEASHHKFDVLLEALHGLVKSTTPSDHTEAGVLDWPRLLGAEAMKVFGRVLAGRFVDGAQNLAKRQNKIPERAAAVLCALLCEGETSWGWRHLLLISDLIESATITAPGVCHVVAEMTLPSTLVRLFYWFLHLPQDTASPSDSPPICVTRADVEARIARTLYHLCQHPPCIRELIVTDELALIFRTAVYDCDPHNISVRDATFHILSGLYCKGIPKEAILYIHEKDIIKRLIGPLRLLPVKGEATSFSSKTISLVLESLVDCLRESCKTIDLLLEDFKLAEGYKIVWEVLLWLVSPTNTLCPTTELELVAILGILADFVFVGTRELEPPVFPEGYQDMPVVGRCVRNLDAFYVLQTLFLRGTDNPPFQSRVLEKILMSVFASHPKNYLILQKLHTLPMFLAKMEGYALNDIKETVLKVLEYVAFVTNVVPFEEISTLALLLEGGVAPTTTTMMMTSVHKLLSFDRKYQRVFRETGFLDVLVAQFGRLSAAVGRDLEAKGFHLPFAPVSTIGHRRARSNLPDEISLQALLEGGPNSRPPSPGVGDSNACCLTEGCITVVTDCLILMLEHCPENVQIFREGGGALAVLNICFSTFARRDALRVLQQLVYQDSDQKERDISNLLQVMKTPCEDSVTLKRDVLACLRRMFSCNPRGRNAFRIFNGFHEVFTMLRSLTSDEEEADSSKVLLFESLFRTIIAAIAAHSKNRAFFRERIGFSEVANIFRKTRFIDTSNGESLLSLLVDIAVEEFDTPFPCPQPIIDLAETKRNYVVRNPEVITSIFEFAHRMSRDVQKRLVEGILQLAKADIQNLESMASAGVLDSVLEYYCDVLVDSGGGELRKVVLQLVETLGTYRMSPKELREFLLFLIQQPLDLERLNLSIRLAETGHSISCVLFDHHLSGYANLRMERVADVQWPPSGGYSFSCWLYIDDFGDEAYPLRIFSFETENHKGVCACFLQNRAICLQTSPQTQQFIKFGKVLLEPNHWYHVALTQSRPALKVFQHSVASLFVDGVFVQSEKLGYPSQTNAPVSGIIGTGSLFQNRTSLRWRLGPTMLFKSILSSQSVYILYKLGPAYSGHFEGHLQKYITCDAFDDSSVPVFQSWDLNTPLGFEPLPVLSMLSFVQDDIIFSYCSAAKKTPPTDITTPDAMGTDDAGIQTLLVNTNAEDGHPVCILEGDTAVLRPRSIGDTLRHVGGVSIALLLMEKARTEETLLRSLEFLVAVLRHNPKNHRNMERQHGYHVLGYILRCKADSLLSFEVLVLLFKLAGFEEENRGKSVIANVLLFERVFMDYDIWKRTKVELQKYLFHQLIESVSGCTQSRFNLQRLRKLRIVPWILSLLADDTLAPDLFSSIVLLLRTVLESRLLKDELQDVANFLVATVAIPEDVQQMCFTWLGTNVRGSNPLGGLFGGGATSDVPDRKRTIPIGKSSPALVRRQQSTADVSTRTNTRFIHIRNILFEMLLNICQDARDDKSLDIFFKVLDYKWNFVFLDYRVHTTTAALALRLLVFQLLSRPQLAIKFRQLEGFQALQHLLPVYFASTNMYYILFMFLFGRAVLEMPAEDPLDFAMFWEALLKQGTVPSFAFPDILGPILAMYRRNLLESFTNIGPVTAAPYKPQSDNRTREGGELGIELTDMDGRGVKPRTGSSPEEDAHRLRTEIPLFLKKLAQECNEFREMCRKSEFIEETIECLFTSAHHTSRPGRDLMLQTQPEDFEVDFESEAGLAIGPHGAGVNADGTGTSPGAGSPLADYDAVPETMSLTEFLMSQMSHSREEDRRDSSGPGQQPITPSVNFSDLEKKYFQNPASDSIFDFLVSTLVDALHNVDQSRRPDILELMLEAIPTRDIADLAVCFQSHLISLMTEQLEKLTKGDLQRNPRLGRNVVRFSSTIVDHLYHGGLPTGETMLLEFFCDFLCKLEADIPVTQTLHDHCAVELFPPLFNCVGLVTLYFFAKPNSTVADRIAITKKIVEKDTIIIGPNNNDPTFLACLTHHLYRFLLDDNQDLREGAMEVWKRLLMSKNEQIREFLLFKNPKGELLDLFSDGFDKLMSANFNDFFFWVGDADVNRDVEYVFEETISKTWRSLEGALGKKRQTYARDTRRRHQDRYNRKERIVIHRQKTQHKASLERARKILDTQDKEALLLRRRKREVTDLHKASSRQWERIRSDLTNERASCQEAPRADRWKLDFTEGPLRMRKKVEYNEKEPGYAQTGKSSTTEQALSRPTTAESEKPVTPPPVVVDTDSGDTQPSPLSFLGEIGTGDVAPSPMSDRQFERMRSGEDIDACYGPQRANDPHASPRRAARAALRSRDRSEFASLKEQLLEDTGRDVVEHGRGPAEMAGPSTVLPTTKSAHGRSLDFDAEPNDSKASSSARRASQSSRRRPSRPLGDETIVTKEEGAHKVVKIQEGHGEEKEREEEEEEEEEEENDESEDEEAMLAPYLEPGDYILFRCNCLRVAGLDTYDGLFLLCENATYMIDNYSVNADGEIVEGVTHESSVEVGAVTSAATRRDGTDSAADKRDLPHKVRVWHYEDTTEIHLRYYLLRPVAIEIFSRHGLNYLLVFNIDERDDVYNRLLSMELPNLTVRPEFLKVTTVSKLASTRTAMSLDKRAKKMFRRQLTTKWQNGELSNLRYLMALNTLAGRSYNDLTQYHVFPWVLADYESEELDLTQASTFRDLSKPMGALSEKRRENFISRYENWDDPIIPKYHYGTHYSTAGIVLHYLVRLEPFTNLAFKLQGNKFDLVDRMFHSIHDAWKSASCDNMQDVKELVPEFFYMPEFLENRNHFNFGVRQTGEPLDSAILPPWAKGSTREFIRLHRQALESEYVSEHLNEWIDLIFGFKQRGREAEAATNVFFYLTYEGSVTIEKIENVDQRKATIAQIHLYGQTPRQLFKKPHPKRTTTPQHHGVYTHPEALIVSLLRGPTGHKIGQITFDDHDRPMTRGFRELVLPPNYAKYIQWGNYDNSVRLFTVGEDRLTAIFDSLHNGNVVCLCVANDGRLIATGGIDTVVSLWRIEKRSGRQQYLENVEHFYGHYLPVSCVALSTAYSILVSGSLDRTCIVWDINRLRYVRGLKGHRHAIDGVYINDQSGDIITVSRTTTLIYSINGDVLVAQELCETVGQDESILSVTVSEGPEWLENAVIVTGHRNGIIRIWSKKFVQSRKTSVTEGGREERSVAEIASGLGSEYRLVLRDKIHAHQYGVTALCISSDQKKLFSGDTHGIVLSWALPDDRTAYDQVLPMSNFCATCRRVIDTETRVHCRSCGHAMCSQCSTLRSMKLVDAPVRPLSVCESCFESRTSKRR